MAKGRFVIAVCSHMQAHVRPARVEKLLCAGFRVDSMTVVYDSLQYRGFVSLLFIDLVLVGTNPIQSAHVETYLKPHFDEGHVMPLSTDFQPSAWRK